MVLQFGLPPKYVLDEMQAYEAKSLMDYAYYRNKEEWEQARLVGYLIAQANSRKRLKLQDIIKFTWEKESANTEVTKEEINELARQAERMEAMFSQNND